MAKKKKGKKSKSEKKSEKKKSKGPTEKELFLMQIEQLRQLLEVANRDLESAQAMLEDAKHSLDSEVDSKAACVAHLKKKLCSENGRRLEIQEQLQTELDLRELVERRALGKLAVSEQNGEVAKSLFLQQKMELEGKLFLLEELRLARNSQRAHLQKVEESLQEKTAILLSKSREEDMQRVEKLLKNRDTFLCMSRDVRLEWRQAFQLRLPVYAKRQLQDNARLREACDKNTEKLLKFQEDNRTLKQWRKCLELQEEIQSAAENNTNRRKEGQELRLCRLLQTFDDLSQEYHKQSKKTSEELQEVPCHLESSKEQLGTMKDEDIVERQLEDNVRLRETCNKSTEIRKVQEDNRTLKQRRKCLELEEEIQFGEENKRKRIKKGQELRLCRLLQTSDDLNQEYLNQNQKTSQELQEVPRHLESSKQQQLGTTKDEDIEMLDCVRDQADFSWKKKNAIGRRIESRIREREIEHCVLEDRLNETNVIVQDQAEYAASLKREMEANVDRNGAMISAILRAGRVFRARCGKMEREGMDFDLLHQIRMILDIERENCS